MSRKSSSLVNERQSSLSGNLALQGSFSRIEDGSRFSSKIPEVTNYDDYQYSDCDYDDSGKN
ncbi:MAG: hypothetical protein Q8O71_03720 [bacterium]|nr:hypothetical protein [bacterium]